MPAARRSGGAIIENGAPALIGSPRPIHTSKACPRPRSFPSTSCANRDFPMPASAVTSATRAPGSATASSKSPMTTPSSRSRPTHGVGLPSSVRADSMCSRSPTRSRPARSPDSSNRVSSKPAVTSSTRTGDCAAACGLFGLCRSIDAARSITSPRGNRSAIVPRPVASDIAQSGTTARIESAHRAARTARSIAEADEDARNVATTEPSAIGSSCPPCVLTAAESIV